MLETLKPEVSPGLGGLRNEHLTAILFHPNKAMSPAAHGAFDKFYEYTSNVVGGDMPSYFYMAWAAIRLTVLNKFDLRLLSPDEIPDGRLIGVSNSKRCAITKVLIDPFARCF